MSKCVNPKWKNAARVVDEVVKPRVEKGLLSLHYIAFSRTTFGSSALESESSCHLEMPESGQVSYSILLSDIPGLDLAYDIKCPHTFYFSGRIYHLINPSRKTRSSPRGPFL